MKSNTVTLTEYLTELLYNHMELGALGETDMGGPHIVGVGLSPHLECKFGPYSSPLSPALVLSPWNGSITKTEYAQALNQWVQTTGVLRVMGMSV